MSSEKNPPMPDEVKKPRDGWEDFGVIDVAGVSYDNRRATIKWLKENNPQGFKVECIPEPRNEYDKHAVAVYGCHGKRKFHIGYIPRGIAKEIHKLKLTAELVEARVKSRGEYDSSVAIRVKGKKIPSAGLGCLIVLLVIIVLFMIF